MKYCTNKTKYAHSKSKIEDFEFTFETPSQYLEFRAEWKANYKGLSGEIRSMKAERCADNGGTVPGLYEKRLNARNQMICLAAAKLAGKERKAKALAERALSE